MQNNLQPDQWKTLFLFLASIVAALAGYIRQIRKASKSFSFPEFLMELVVSLFCGFIAWYISIWANLDEPLAILSVCMASFAGSKSADFFEDAYFSLLKTAADRKVSKKNDQ